MDLDTLSRTSGAWLKGTGPDADIVVSSRIRLARNLAGFPFVSRADDATRGEIEGVLRSKFETLQDQFPLSYLSVNQLPQLDRQFLVERQLISREHADSDGCRGVGISEGENVSLMINEEDHLRIQVLNSGLSLDTCWDQINRIDDSLEQELTYAFSEQLGYLTACPTNVGTGIRVSVLLHLPALVLTRSEIQKVFAALHKINLAVRGLYGEGSHPVGDFFQVSNQITLGKSEQQLIDKLTDVVPVIIDNERQARSQLFKKKRTELHDEVSTAYGRLEYARTITTEETMAKLSSLRMGINLGLIDDLDIPAVNELLIHTQPAHLQKLRGADQKPIDTDIVRANFLRGRLADARKQRYGLDQPLPDTDDLRLHIDHVVGESPDNRVAAERLKVGTSSLNRKIKELEIDP